MPLTRSTIKMGSSSKNGHRVTRKRHPSSHLYHSSGGGTKLNTHRATVARIRAEGAGALDELSEAAIARFTKAARDAYYNDAPIMSDNEYDILEEFVSAKFPDILDSIGVGASSGSGRAKKVKLPYFMGSMDKIKPDTNAIDRWKKAYTGPYVLSAKLDGVSGLYSVCGDASRLYTRGNGSVGQDISKFIGKLNMPGPDAVAATLSSKHPSPPSIVVRGEFIIRTDIFKLYYGSDFANARNFVAGVINSGSPGAKKLGHVDFVAYELIHPALPPSQQLDFLTDRGFVVAQNARHSAVSNELLSKVLVDWRGSYAYEMDGVICADDNVHSRPTAAHGNPDYAFAFKMVLGDQIAEAKVLAVEWAASKDGLLKPRVRFEPVVLGGARIEYATAFNAQFVISNRLGLGAKIRVIRSGDVIPYIMAVVEPAEHTMMPNEEYEWHGTTHVDIALLNKGDSKEVRAKNVVFFFRTLDVDGMGPGNATRLAAAGYDTVPRIVAASHTDLLGVDGFKDKMATKLHDGIRVALARATLSDLMVASNTFGHGMGKKKFDAVLADYPDAIVSAASDATKVARIIAIGGMARKSAELFVSHIPDFVAFLDEIGVSIASLSQSPHPHNTGTGTGSNPNHTPKSVDTTHPLYGKSVVITGFRDATLVKRLVDMGARNATSVSKSTFALVTPVGPVKSSGKVAQAEKLGVAVFDVEKFMDVYGLGD